MQNKFVLFFVGVMFVVVAVGSHALPVFAQGATGNQQSAPAGATGGITNPLGQGGSATITDVLTGIIKWMLGLVAFLALIALIVGGGRMIIDFGNEEQVKKGKTTITWAIIGLAVVVFSYAILNIVVTEVLGGKAGQGESYDSLQGNQ